VGHLVEWEYLKKKSESFSQIDRSPKKMRLF
jgi:hypothetical protein